MINKWTPGKWVYDERTGSIVAIPSPDNGGDIVCSEPGIGAGPSWDYWQHNLHLISAAPDMAECASFLLDRLADLNIDDGTEELWRDWNGHVEPAISRLKAALAKARGET